jgi:hypothetical protein
MAVLTPNVLETGRLGAGHFFRFRDKLGPVHTLFRVPRLLTSNKSVHAVKL